MAGLGGTYPLGDASSPGKGAWPTLEGADEVGRYPAAVVVALLGLDALVVHPGGVHAPGVEGDVAAKRLVALSRTRVRPADRVGKTIAHAGVEVARRPLELTR